MIFYAYLWLREDGTPWYVGKGTRRRAFVAHSKSGFTFHPPRDRSRVLILPRASEREAFATEIELIRNWGRKDLGTGCLRNLTDGGDGSSGYKFPPEVWARRQSTKGRHLHPATEFTSERWKGKKRPLRTAEHCRKLSIAKTGKNLGHRSYATPEGIEKMRIAKLGKQASVETRRKMSESQKAAWLKRKAQGGIQL
jgi:hypothetical protein